MFGGCCDDGSFAEHIWRVRVYGNYLKGQASLKVKIGTAVREKIKAMEKVGKK